MLTILTRDESFHVPLNVHFLKRVLERRPQSARQRMRALYVLLFASLAALPLASRPKAKAFDRISTLELSRAYARELGSLFANEPELGLMPPRVLLWALGLSLAELRKSPGEAVTSVAAAEAAADRAGVTVTSL